MTRAASREVPFSLRDVVAIPLIVGAIAAVVWFRLTGHLGYDLADEGFLWYGAQRTAAGDMPIRDFAAYDIARYYYVAPFLRLLGDDGVIAVRIACFALTGITTAIAVGLVLACARQRGDGAVSRALQVVAIAPLVVLWVFPYYKVFESFATLLLMLGLFTTWRHPTRARWFALGAIVGVNAMIGRNHGLYGVAATVLAAVLLTLRIGGERPRVQLLLWWGFGLCLGYAPVLAMLASSSGFADPFIDWIVRMLNAPTTNIPLPVPWMWVMPIDIVQDGRILTAARLGVGVGFVALLVVPAILALRAVTERTSARAVAPALTVCVVLPYAQYAFSRADTVHLATAALPLVVGVWMTLETRWLASRMFVAVAMFFASAAALYWSPPVNYALNGRTLWEDVDIGPDRLVVQSTIAHRLRRRETLLASSDGRRDFLALPDMPSLHAAHRVPMVVHEIYVLQPTTPERERVDLERLRAKPPSLILISEHELDGNPAWRYSLMRPQTYAWITANYRRSTLVKAERRDPLEAFVR